MKNYAYMWGHAFLVIPFIYKRNEKWNAFSETMAFCTMFPLRKWKRNPWCSFHGLDHVIFSTLCILIMTSIMSWVDVHLWNKLSQFFKLFGLGTKRFIRSSNCSNKLIVERKKRNNASPYTFMGMKELGTKEVECLCFRFRVHWAMELPSETMTCPWTWKTLENPGFHSTF